MKSTKYFIAVFCLMVFVMTELASAHLTIDSADKFLKTNGEKRFMVFSGLFCSDFSEYRTEPCANTIAHNPDLDGMFFNAPPTYIHDSAKNYFVDDDFNAAKKYFMGNIQSDSVTNPIKGYWTGLQYWGGYIHADEPNLNTSWKPLVPLSKLQSDYALVKSVDPNHPVFVNIMDSGPYDFVYYQGIADVFMSDVWTKSKGQPWNSGGLSPDWGYILEREKERTSYRNIADVETWNKPIFGFITSMTDKCARYYEDELKDLRFQAYLQIAWGVKGIDFYPNRDTMASCSGPGDSLESGYWSDSTKYNYINTVLARELHNYSWIFAPSTAKSWGKIDGGHYNPTGVTFSNNPSKVVTSWAGSSTHKRFNYMLKNIDSANSYLIVVNKDAAQTTTNITIPSLAGTGSRTAKTIGLETSGSAKAGRTIPVNNGKFTDTFDGYGAHVYQICSGTCSSSNPQPTCTDSIQNQGETGIDCGGPCSTCSSSANQLTLKPGWNQISSPVAAGISLATIESSCTILPYKNKKLWSWNATAQVWTNPTKVEPFKGYWIYAAYQCTIPLSGTSATFSSLQLYNGWNKISASGTLSAIQGTCSGHVTGNWVWNWDKATEKWIHPATMQLDKGYWIKVDQNCVLGV